MTAFATDSGGRTTNCRNSSFRVQRSSLGFTLVEMLVVITIIGILASLATVAAYKALEAAKRARITAEMANLDGAMKAYKEKFGDYPPSTLDQTDSSIALPALRRFLSKAFPRCTPDVEIAAIPRSLGGLATYNAGSATFTSSEAAQSPDQALVFWLTSISKDPVHPISAATVERQSFFDFDKTRLKTTTGAAGGWTNSGGTIVYTPQNYHPANLTAPYVYFEARNYLTHAVDNTTVTNTGCCPYLMEPWDVNNNNSLDAGATGPTAQDVQWDSSSNWLPGSYQAICANPKSFQIISAGLDDKYGDVNSIKTVASVKVNGTTHPKLYYKSFPTGAGYDTGGADDDNLTNFSDKQLGDAKP